MMAWLIRAACPRPADSPEPLPRQVAMKRAAWLPKLAGVLSGFGAPAAAVTLGRTIVVHPSVQITSELVRHELAHVRQWQQERWLFPVRYAWNHMRYGYHDNPYEVAARAAETRSSA